MDLLHVSEVLTMYPHPELTEWQQRVGKQEARRVCRVTAKDGSSLHALIKADLLGQPVPKRSKLSAEVQSCWQGYQQWRALHARAPISLDEPYTCKRLGLVFTPDDLEPDEVTEWKTTTTIRRTHWIQAHTYAALARMELGLPITRVRVVRFDRVLGTFDAPPVVPYDPKAFRVFLGLLRTLRDYQATQQRSRWDERVAITP